MLSIGLLGGMSWESTAEYYRLLNEVVRDRLGGLHCADVLIASVDFADIERLQVKGRWDEAGLVLAERARGLEAAGAELLLLCTNTMHKVAAPIEAAISIPFLHLGDATANAVRRAGITTVGLLGTAFTMEQDFYRDRLETHGLTVLIPDSDDRAEIHRIIYEELVLGMVREESRTSYRATMNRLVAAGADGIILGCTEIELLIGQDDSDVPVFPTTRNHVEAAVDAALARSFESPNVDSSASQPAETLIATAGDRTSRAVVPARSHREAGHCSDQLHKPRSRASRPGAARPGPRRRLPAHDQGSRRDARRAGGPIHGPRDRPDGNAGKRRQERRRAGRRRAARATSQRTPVLVGQRIPPQPRPDHRRVDRP
jgi:aspartate racemase